MKRLLTLVAMIAVLGSEARAQGSVPLVADLSSHLVAIAVNRHRDRAELERGGG